MYYNSSQKSLFIRCVVSLVLVTMVTCQAYVEEMFLFPGKKSWCDVQPIRQEVSWPGCVPKLLPNGVCFGQCFSYSIPQVMPENPDPKLQHCESCKPLVTSKVEVTLHCPFSEVRQVVRVIDVVEECACQECDIIISEKRDADMESSASYSTSSYFSDYDS